MDNQSLMDQERNNFEEAINSLKYVLKVCGFNLEAVRISPRPGTAAQKLLKSNDIEVL